MKMAKWFIEASKNTLFYEVFLSKMAVYLLRAIFYPRYLIEFKMFRDLTFRIILHASSSKILQFCNVRK